MSAESEYLFWMVWGTTYEGDRRWFMVRTPDTWDSEMVMERAKEGTMCGGVGGDMAYITDVEIGYDDGIWTDYVTEDNSQPC